MISHAVDYFASVGRRPGPIELKPSCSSRDFVHPSVQWGDAITDVVIIFPDKGETLPSNEENWELVEYSIGGAVAQSSSGDISRRLPIIGLKRRKFSNRIDHICQVCIIQKGEELPLGFEVIEKSFSGEHIADLNRGSITTMVAIKRSPVNNTIYIYGTPLIDDICLVISSKDEDIPEGYVCIEKNLHKGLNGDKVFLAYHQIGPIGLCDLGYESATIDRYPLVDNKNFVLPVNELAMFTFPHNIQLKYCAITDFPIPDYFTFVFTDIKGKHQYVACLRFYDIIPKEDVLPMFHSIYGEGNGSSSELLLDHHMQLFCPQVICVLSHHPFYRAMGRYLKQLYSISLSPSSCPMEHFIGSVVSCVPLPVPGGRPFHIVLDASLISKTSKSLPEICIQLPPKKFFPVMDLDFAGPLRCLSVDHVLAVFYMLLRESKVLFLCHSNALLTEVMETFRSLLFPLMWTSCFVTRLADSLSGLLEAPGGYMIGVHLEKECNPNMPLMCESFNSKKVGSVVFDSSKVTWMSSLQRGTYIVDLSQNKIYLFNGSSGEIMNQSKIQGLLKHLPPSPLKKLHTKLVHIADKFQLCPTGPASGLEQFDSAFEFQPRESNVLMSGLTWNDFPTLHIRDYFLVFMIDILGDYPVYVKPPILDDRVDKFRTFKEEFMVEDYIQDAEKQVKGIIVELMETQMFANILQRRSEELCHDLEFFEEASYLLRDLGLTLSGDLRGISLFSNSEKSTNVPLIDLDSEVPLFEFLKRYNDISLASSSGRLKSLQLVRQKLATSNVSKTELKCIIPDRHELINAETSYNFSLEDISLGPLIIPGPSHISPILDDANAEDAIRRQYRYDRWPALSNDFIDMPNVKHPNLNNIISRISVLHKVDSKMVPLIRDMDKRFSYRNVERMLTNLNADLFQETLSTIALIIDVYQITFTTLALRSVSNINRRPHRIINEVLQLFAIIHHLDSLNLLSYVDQTGWRAMFLTSSCLEHDIDLKRKSTSVLYETMQIANAVASGFQPEEFTRSNSMTFHLYMKSLEDKSNDRKSKIASVKVEFDDNDVIDPFYYLEIIGLCWFAHRVVPWNNLDETKSVVAGDTSSASSSLSTSPGPGNFVNIRKTSSFGNPGVRGQANTSMLATTPPLAKKSSWSFFSATKKSSTGHNRYRRRSITSSNASNRLAINVLELVKRGGVFSALKWNSRVLHSVPMCRNCFSPDNTIKVDVVSYSDADIRDYCRDFRHAWERQTSMIKSRIDSRSHLEMDEGDVLEVLFHGIRVPQNEDIVCLKKMYFVDVQDTLSEAKTKFRSEVELLSGALNEYRYRCVYIPLNKKYDDQKLIMQLYRCEQYDESDPKEIEKYCGEVSETLSTSSLVNNNHSSWIPFHNGDSRIIAEVNLRVKLLSHTEYMSKINPSISKSISSLPSPPTLSSTPSVSVSPSAELTTEKTWIGRFSFGFTNKNKQQSSVDIAKNSSSVASAGNHTIEIQSSDKSSGLNYELENIQQTKSSDDVFRTPSKLSTQQSGSSYDEEDCSSAERLFREQAANTYDCYESKAFLKLKVIGMYSATPCVCGCVLLDEHIMSSWCGNSDINSRPMNWSGNMLEAHRIPCPQCNVDIVPTLHIKLFSSDMSARVIDNVAYISPYGLRYFLEEAVQDVGLKCIDTNYLIKSNPILLWNIVWYTQRMNVPSGFLPIEELGVIIQEPILSFPIVISWRECVAESKARFIIEGNPNGDLLLTHIFPYGNSADLECAMKMKDILDGSVESIRTGILILSSLKSITSEFGATRPRNLYLALLTMIYAFRNSSFLSSSPNMPHMLYKGIAFDQKYLNALFNVFTEEDYLSIGMSQADLMNAASSSLSVAIRIGFGFLF